MEGRWRRTGGRKTPPEQIQPPERLAEEWQALWLLPSFRHSSGGSAAAGCRHRWVCSAAQHLPGSTQLPSHLSSSSAPSVHWQSSTGQGFGGSVISGKCHLPPFSLHLLQCLQILLLKTHPSLTSNRDWRRVNPGRAEMPRFKSESF